MRARMSEWMNKSVIGDIKRTREWVLERKKYILIILSWSAGFVLVTHKIVFQRPGPPFYLANLTEIDLVLIFIFSVIAGMFLADVKRVLYGYIGAMVLAVAVLLFIWNVRDFFLYGELYGSVWSWILFRSMSMVFKQLFPGALMLSFLGVFFGGLLGEKLGLE